MRLVHRLLILVLAPTVALTFVVTHQRLSVTRKSSCILAAFNDSSAPPIVKSRRDLRIEQLQQEIERQLQEREELRLQLEQDIADFEKQYEAERNNLKDVDASITKQIQRLEQIKTAGGGLQQVLDSLGSLDALARLAALSGAAVVGRSALVQRRQRLLDLEERERERERLEQEAEIKRIMEEAAQKKLIQTRRRTALASIAGAGVIGTGLFVTILTDETSTLNEASLQEATAPVLVDATPNESRPRSPEDGVAPSIAQVDTPPPTISNEESEPILENQSGESFGSAEISKASERSGAVSKALEKLNLPDNSDISSRVSDSFKGIDFPDTTKLGDTITLVLQNVSGNTKVVAGVGATATAALVATLVGLSKDEKASDSRRPPLKTGEVFNPTRSADATIKDDIRLDQSTAPAQNPPSSLSVEKPVPVNSKPQTTPKHMDAKPKTETIAEKTPNQSATVVLKMSATESQPIPASKSVADRMAKEHDGEAPTEVKPTLRLEQREVTSESDVSKATSAASTEKYETMVTTQKTEVTKVPPTMIDDASKVSVLKPKTILEKDKSVSTPSTSSMNEKQDMKIIDMRPMENQPDTSKPATAGTQNSKTRSSNSFAESEQKDLKPGDAVLSSFDIQEIKSKVFGKTDDSSVDTSTTVPGNSEGPNTEASYSKSSNGITWKQDSFSDDSKPSDENVIPEAKKTETELKGNDEPNPEMAQARKPAPVNRSPARGFGKPVPPRSKHSKSSKN